MNPHPQHTAHLAEQAADWVTRLEDQPTRECRAELVDWLRTSPRHVEEFLLAQATYRALHALGPEHGVDIDALLAAENSAVVPLTRTTTAAELKAAGRRRRRLSGPLAAGFAAAALTAGAWLWIASGNTGLYTTAVGEQRSVRLSDGSLMLMNTASKVQVVFSDNARHIRLLAGEALFDVQHDATRPLQVAAGNAVIDVLGTQCNVRRRDEETQVSVVDGRVQVRAAQAAHPGETAPAVSADKQPAALLSAGEEVRVTPAGEVLRTAEVDMKKTLAWRQRRLVFHGTPLTEVVAEFNRHNELQVILVDERLGQRQISGVFDANDPETILKFLRDEPTVVIDRRANEIMLRTR